MSKEFLVSAVETRERQGENFMARKEEDGSVVTFATTARSLQPAAYKQEPCR